MKIDPIKADRELFEKYSKKPTKEKENPPTEKQKKFAWAIARLIHDDEGKLFDMDKWQMSNYISEFMSKEENVEMLRKHNEERKREWARRGLARIRRKYERGFDKAKAYHSDETLGGDWGLDAHDFGIQAWGDS